MIKILHQQQLPNGDMIEIRQRSNRRCLYINDILQSEIAIDAPENLTHPLHHALLVQLLFKQPINSVLLAGGGGGALIHWFNKHLPNTTGTCCEINEHIIKIAQDYFDHSQSNSRWQWRQDDIQNFVLNNMKVDSVILDLSEGDHTPEFLTSISFLSACKRLLTGNGMLTLNFIAKNEQQFLNALANIRYVFNKNTCCLPVNGFDNIIILASSIKQSLFQAEDIRQIEKQYHLPMTQMSIDLMKHNPQNSGLI